MITQVNATNNDKYTILFDKVSKLLGREENDGIQTLDQYFFELTAIAEIAKKNNYSLLKLPLDEEPFYINLNDRSITIPEAFKKSGLGIKGDEAVEIIYFAVDPYFDITDITQGNIAIEWQSPQDSGLTAALFRQFDKTTGKYVFGWPLTSNITAAVGTVKFAVRFYDIDKSVNQYRYNLSTSTVELAIRDSLVTDLTKGTIEVQEKQEDLLSRIVSSNLIGTPVAKTPFFVNASKSTESETGAVVTHYNEGLMILNEEGEYIDITSNNNKKQNINTLLYALAGRDDTGYITYKWYFKEKNAEGEFTGNIIEVTPKEATEYRKAKKIIPGLIYYTVDETGEYSPYTGESTDLKSQIENLYNRYTVYTLGEGVEEGKKIGAYYAVATNTLLNDKAEASTILCEIEGPAEIVFATGTTPSFIELYFDNVKADNNGLTNNDNWSNKVVINTNTPKDGTVDEYYWAVGNSDSKPEELSYTKTTSAEHIIDSEGVHYYYVQRSKNGGTITSTIESIEAVYRPLKGTIVTYGANYEGDLGYYTIPTNFGTVTYNPADAEVGHTVPSSYKCELVRLEGNEMIKLEESTSTNGVFSFNELSSYDNSFDYYFIVTAQKGERGTSTLQVRSMRYKFREADVTATPQTAPYSLPSYKIIE